MFSLLQSIIFLLLSLSVSINRPADPISFLAGYLLKNKAQYETATSTSSTATQPSTSATWSQELSFYIYYVPCNWLCVNATNIVECYWDQCRRLLLLHKDYLMHSQSFSNLSWNLLGVNGSLKSMCWFSS